MRSNIRKARANGPIARLNAEDEPSDTYLHGMETIGTTKFVHNWQHDPEHFSKNSNIISCSRGDGLVSRTGEIFSKNVRCFLQVKIQGLVNAHRPLSFHAYAKKC